MPISGGKTCSLFTSFTTCFDIYTDRMSIKRMKPRDLSTFPTQKRGVDYSSTDRLWSNRDFLLLWSGQAISTLGTYVSNFALPLLVLALTHSPAQAGIIAAL